MNLTGVARQVWSDCMDSSVSGQDYQSLVKAMGDRFQPKGQVNTYKAEFRGRRRKKDETFIELGYALRRLAIRAYPNIAHEAREEMILDQFLTGLDAEMRKHVSLAHPGGVDQAITLATEYDNICETVKNPLPSKPRPVALVQETGANDDATLNQLVGLLTQLKNQLAPGQGPICFQCGKACHVKRRCPQLVSNTKAAQQPLNQ